MEFPSENSLRWLVSGYAQFLAAHGEAIGRPDLVLPTGDYFPDEFTMDPEGVLRVARRILAYAPVSDDIDLKLAILSDSDDESAQGGGCGTGSCGTGGGCGTGGASSGVRGGQALETQDGYALTLAPQDAGNPVLLTTALARGVGHLVLHEAGEIAGAEDAGAKSELAATAIGLGTLMLSGAFVYGKSCGGVNVRQATFLDPYEHAVLLALFCRVNGAKPSAARAHVGATQREALDEALRWVDSNPHLVEALSLHPESLADGVFLVEAPKSFFGRLFGRKPERVAPSAPSSQKRARTAEEERRLAEARALVDEALGPR